MVDKVISQGITSRPSFQSYTQTHTYTHMYTHACTHVQFIDAMEGASGPSGAGVMMPPEDTALTLAISAAQLCNAPRLRARALLLAGQCLQV